MNSNREELLFQLALLTPAEERAAFLIRECRGDNAMRRRLEALLAAHQQTVGALADASPAAVATMKIEFTDAPDETIGQKIGRYKILEKVGEGGCGVVYVAEQTEPVRRRVALKVIKLGMDTKQVVARFEAERQALAMMDHPNIAKVLDAGATETGRPYFIMELVRGIRITDYCDQNNLSTNERLDLFIKVCQAIQHAHQKGIIHRDIKPSNILVTLHDGVPVPKVIDFGIAKATEGRLTEATVYTQLHQFIGTPAYMSPEQAEMSGLDIDTRSDIYSLGVLLYELLTGRTPFDAQELVSQGIDQMRKTIREKEPLRPSTKLATLQGDELTTTAKRRSVETSKLANLLRGDLDWIVMKCLEKDRTRRYETANGLAFDLKRHQNNETVLARPPSSAYRFQKLVRRNKVSVAAATVVFTSLCLGIIATTLQSVRATRAKQEALAAQAQAVAAQASESKLKAQAQAQELAARQRAYASDMNVAKQALDGNNLGRALDLLNQQTNKPGEQDLRGWEWRYLWQQTRSDALYTLCQQSNEIESLVASSDGRWLAVGVEHNDGLFVYDLQTRKQVAHLAPREGGLRAAFSPTEPLLAFTSEEILASGEKPATLHLWNAATRRVLGEFPLDSKCWGLAFAKDGRTLVISTEQSIITWRVPEGTRLDTYSHEGHGTLAAATDFAATSDLSLAAYATKSGEVHVIDLRNDHELWSKVISKQFVTALAFSPDGKTLASAAGIGESNIHLWEAATGREIGSPLEGHRRWVASLVFWPDGKKLASSSADQTIRIWDVASRQCLDVLRGHMEVSRLALLPDNKTLVSGCKDGTVCLWDTGATHPGRGRMAIPDSVVNWCFTPDSRSVLTLNQQGQVSRWTGSDFQQRDPVLEVGTKFSPSRTHRHHLFSGDARYLAISSTNGTISVWDVSQRVLRDEFRPGDGDVLPKSFLDHGNRLIVWSETGKRFSEWDLAANREIQSWAGPVSFEGHGVSPDERLVVAVGFEGQVVCRDLQNHSSTNLPLDALEGWTVEFSADGTALVISSALGYARVWDTATWQERATLHGFLNAVDYAVFSPDNTRLLTSGSHPEDEMKLWSGDTHQELLTLEGAGNNFDPSAFSPDSNVIGAMSNEGILSLWRAPSWSEINAADGKENWRRN
jgi:serine/threonine protein kinase/WD40 repeat protein